MLLASWWPLSGRHSAFVDQEQFYRPSGADTTRSTDKEHIVNGQAFGLLSVWVDITR